MNITVDRAVIEQALEALEAMNPYPASKEDQRNKAITALRIALEQPEQEPVATVTSKTGAEISMSWWHEPALPVGTKLYTAPQRRPEQEPVAWIQPKTVDAYLRPDLGYETCSKSDYGAFPVYTAPPQRKPLTDEEIEVLAQKHLQAFAQFIGAGEVHYEGEIEFARAIEAAHGIKEPT